MERVNRSMGILVPRQLAGELQMPRAAPILGVFYGLNDVTGQRASLADLMQALGKYRRSDLIRWIAAVSRWTADDSAIQQRNQMGMAEALLPEQLLGRVREHVRQMGDGKWCLFHRRQMWFLLQATLLATRDDAPSADEEVLRRAVGECCMMVSDILQQLESQGGTRGRARRGEQVDDGGSRALDGGQGAV